LPGSSKQLASPIATNKSLNKNNVSSPLKTGTKTNSNSPITNANSSSPSEKNLPGSSKQLASPIATNKSLSTNKGTNNSVLNKIANAKNDSPMWSSTIERTGNTDNVNPNNTATTAQNNLLRQETPGLNIQGKKDKIENPVILDRYNTGATIINNKEICLQCEDENNFVLNSHNANKTNILSKGTGNFISKNGTATPCLQCEDENNFVLNSHNMVNSYNSIKSWLPQKLNKTISTNNNFINSEIKNIKIG
jgi:hypothetical protein